MLRLISSVRSAKDGASDAELVRQVQQGNEAAQAQLFYRHFSSVRGLVFRLVPNDRELEDLVQDTFVQAMESIASLRTPEAFSSWLRGIAIRVVRNRLRRRGIARRLGLSGTDTSHDEVVLSREAPPDVAADLRATYRAIAGLRVDSRIILELSRVEGLTNAEVAEALELSLSTVKRRIASAEVELRDELDRLARGGT
ncbi:MAG: RNA polymerase sigma factor [Polyangiaceae bacterium]|nr:RNA polymerase sigma factor [Polyangiaceae bacterium]